MVVLIRFQGRKMFVTGGCDGGDEFTHILKLHVTPSPHMTHLQFNLKTTHARCVASVSGV